MDSINPLNGQKIKSYSATPLTKVDGILTNTHQAFEAWRRLSFDARGAKMKKAAKILLNKKEKFAGLMADEMGKPLDQGRAEIEKCAKTCVFYAQEAKNYLAPEPVKTDASKSFIAFEPLGVVLAIMPWNFPFWQVFRCAAPTLMAGNAMVLKHASNVSGCSVAIEKVFVEAGFPKDIFRSIFLENKNIKTVIEHPLIAAVTLTGSTRAGKSVGSEAGAVLKKTVLELGGSDPYIILEDADLSLAAEICVAGRLVNAGQSCVAAKRFIVVESVFEKFTENFVGFMRAQKMGSPLDKDVTLGPMARHDLRDELHKQVQKSVKLGAKLLLGGIVPKNNPGAFYPPTVLINVKPGMPAYHEELFGPVAVILKVKNEKDAIRIANDTVFGLGSGVFTGDLNRGERVARQIQAGFCAVNDFVRSDPRLPFGGIKQSGYGRELSGFGIREFVNIKTIYVK